MLLHLVSRDDFDPWSHSLAHSAKLRFGRGRRVGRGGGVGGRADVLCAFDKLASRGRRRPPLFLRRRAADDSVLARPDVLAFDLQHHAKLPSWLRDLFDLRLRHRGCQSVESRQKLFRLSSWPEVAPGPEGSRRPQGVQLSFDQSFARAHKVGGGGGGGRGSPLRGRLFLATGRPVVGGVVAHRGRAGGGFGALHAF